MRRFCAWVLGSSSRVSLFPGAAPLLLKGCGFRFNLHAKSQNRGCPMRRFCAWVLGFASPLPGAAPLALQGCGFRAKSRPKLTTVRQPSSRHSSLLRQHRRFCHPCQSKHSLIPLDLLAWTQRLVEIIRQLHRRFAIRIVQLAHQTDRIEIRS